MLFEIEEVSYSGLDFNFQINKGQFGIDEEDCSLNKDVIVTGLLTRVDDDVYLVGRVVTELALRCSRCLNQMFHPVNSRLKAHFKPSNDNPTLVGEMELNVSDIDTEPYKNNQIDLTQSVRDRILLEIPVISMCMDNCKGICLQCGVKLNEVSCDCEDEPSIDPRLEILKKFKNKLR